MVDKNLEEQGNLSEYVVRGACIVCSMGSASDVINMPYSHGVFLKDNPQVNIADSSGGLNIISFGVCSRSVPPPPCTPAIAMDWINLQETKLQVGSDTALIKDAVVFCTFGGKIEITDSGQ